MSWFGFSELELVVCVCGGFWCSRFWFVVVWVVGWGVCLVFWVGWFCLFLGACLEFLIVVLWWVGW